MNQVKTSPYILSLAELQRLPGRKSRLPKEQLIDLGSRGKAVPPALVREVLSKRGISYDPRVIVHINLKGGIGKTTCAITTATRAVQYGFHTCILDLDSQGSASLTFDSLPEEDDPIFYDIWQKPAELLPRAIREIQEGLWLLPSSLENGLLDSALTNPRHQKTAVSNCCNVLKDEGFHLIMVDCPPSLGTAVISSICAADVIVIPIGSDPFSIKGLQLTLSEIHAICDTYQLPVPAIKVLFSRYDRREKMAQKVLDLLKETYAAHAVPVHIRVSTEYSKALDKHQTIFASMRKSPAREDYDIYTRHLLNLP